VSSAEGISEWAAKSVTKSLGFPFPFAQIRLAKGLIVLGKTKSKTLTQTIAREAAKFVEEGGFAITPLLTQVCFSKMVLCSQRNFFIQKNNNNNNQGYHDRISTAMITYWERARPILAGRSDEHTQAFPRSEVVKRERSWYVQPKFV
jgi:hypothetical protein